jgi:hypothetical protein
MQDLSFDGLCFVHGEHADCPTLPQRSAKWLPLIQRLCRYYAVSIYRYCELHRLGVHRTMGVRWVVADC